MDKAVFKKQRNAEYLVAVIAIQQLEFEPEFAAYPKPEKSFVFTTSRCVFFVSKLCGLILVPVVPPQYNCGRATCNNNNLSNRTCGLFLHLHNFLLELLMFQCFCSLPCLFVSPLLFHLQLVSSPVYFLIPHTCINNATDAPGLGKLW